MKQIKLLLIGLISAIAITSTASAQQTCGGFGGMMSGTYGLGGMWFGWVFSVLVLVAIVLFIIWLVKQIQKK